MKTLQFDKGAVDPSRPVFIGIDPSLTAFAVCAYSDDDNWLIRVFKPDTHGPERLAEITQSLVDFVSVNAPRATSADIGIEGTVRQSPSASVLGELTGAVKLTVFQNFGTLPMLNIPPMSAKKYASGTGRGVTKSQMLLAVYKKYGVDLTDDNAADAFVMARIVSGTATTKYEQDVLTKLNNPKFRT